MTGKEQLACYAAVMEQVLAGMVCPDGKPNRVEEAMAYSLCSGGKRVRGALVLAFARLFREDWDAALPFAAALEMVHCYSLIHDDLPCMDNDDLRRGKPSCHIAFGEATALLAGDALLTLAFETIANASGTGAFSSEQVLRASCILARAAGTRGMIGGQMMDLANEGQAVSGERLQTTDDWKTGALFRACAEIGCVLGGAEERQTQAAVEYTRCIGLAFQIVDDILDRTGKQEELGKPINSDIQQNKSTYVSLYGLDRCRELTAELNRQAKDALLSAGLDGPFLCELADLLINRRN